MEERKTREKDSPGFFSQPFRDLKQKMAQTGKLPAAKPGPPRLAKGLDEAALFQEAMREVVPLPRRGAFCVPAQPQPWAPVAAGGEEWEAWCRLAELVEGRGEFDLSWTDEYVEGQVLGLDPRIMAALKAGALPVQDYCDLHGLRVAEAQACLQEFLAGCARRGLRTVLVVHGRGHHSPQHLPILKQQLERWLTMKRFRRQVLAFASAQPFDGGTGALYLLLRRPHRWAGKKG